MCWAMYLCVVSCLAVATSILQTPTLFTPSLLIAGHVLGCQFPGVLPPGTPPDCSLPTYLVNATFPNPWGPSGAANAWLPPSSTPAAAVGWKETKMSVKV